MKIPSMVIMAEEGKAAKLQKMIDDLHDKRIKENREVIEKLNRRK